MVHLSWLRIVLLSLFGDDGSKISGTGWLGIGDDLAFRLVSEPDVSRSKNSLVLRTFFQQRET